ncbi:glycosyltransferase [Streptosporangiaceae bacterium NEAU-GS5]|nr:glycosyltransferase [Streptosporangiaceae bacterium NEAU-GS5]
MRETLGTLTRQTIPAEEFEVIVADDGSSDDTKAVVESFYGRLSVKYYLQEDQGFRAGTARNAGARLAQAPVLVFLDTGELPGPGFLQAHLAGHDGGRRRAVVGYSYGYPRKGPVEGLRDALDRMPPEEVLAHYAGDDGFLDIRHDEFVKCGFDLNARVVPWMLFWSMNCSIRAEEFWAVGGFDERFHRWGFEDMELGLRLHRNGLPFQLHRGAWAIEAPHERDWDKNESAAKQNIADLLAQYPEPVMEIGYADLTTYSLWDWEDDYRNLLAYAEGARADDVADELDVVLAKVPENQRIAIIGSGGKLPASAPPSIVMDFDRELLDQATATGGHTAHHSIGIRTPLADQSVDTVVVTSRLAGLWDRWGGDVMAEARRIGRTVLMSGS